MPHSELTRQKQKDRISTTSVPSQKTGRELHRKVFERAKESKWGNSCKSMWIKQPWDTGHIPLVNLPEFYFLSKVQRKRWLPAAKNLEGRIPKGI